MQFHCTHRSHQVGEMGRQNQVCLPIVISVRIFFMVTTTSNWFYIYCLFVHKATVRNGVDMCIKDVPYRLLVAWGWM